MWVKKTFLNLVFSMESLNPLTRGVNFERTDVVVIAELIRHYLKEYSDSRSVAAWYVLLFNERKN
jgi:hypothetical protein